MYMKVKVMKECKKCGYEHGGVNCFDAGRAYERDHPTVKKAEFKDIVIMADFGSTGLWRKSIKSMCGLMIDYEELNLSIEKNYVRSFWIGFKG